MAADAQKIHQQRPVLQEQFATVAQPTAGVSLRRMIAGIIIAEGMWMVAGSPPLSAFFGVLVSSSVYISLRL